MFKRKRKANGAFKLSELPELSERIKELSAELAEQKEKIIKEVLMENRIPFDPESLRRECRLEVFPNGDEILYHQDKPLVFFSSVQFKLKEDDHTFLRMIQRFKKLY